MQNTQVKHLYSSKQREPKPILKNLQNIAKQALQAQSLKNLKLPEVTYKSMEHLILLKKLTLNEM